MATIGMSTLHALGLLPTRTHSTRGKKVLMSASIKEPINTWEDDTFSRYSGYISKISNGDADIKEYNAEQISNIFKQKPFLLARRLLQVSIKTGTWFGKRYIDSLLGRSQTLFKERAAELREALIELGPAFVKIAQAVSSRPDVIPPEFIEELSYLQDKIAPFSASAALNIIESELGVPIEYLFTEITPEPVAAASLGQVYQARLRANDKIVAVKVQRPGVKAAIALDVFILRILAGYLRAFGKVNTDLQGVVDEWASSLFREMDYENEAENGIRFRRLFGKIPNVKIPEMYKELSSERVLIMEWIEGEKLSETKDIRLVEVGTYCSLSQILDIGFYHADPHPGNLLCTNDGKLAYIDFGMMGEIKENLRDSIIEASLHLVNREFGALAGDFVSLGFIPPTAPSRDVTIALTEIFEAAVNKGVSDISFGDLSGNLGRTMYKFKFRIPSYFSLVIRSLTVLEGVAITIDPNYKVLGRSYPWIARKVLSDNSPTLRSTLDSLLYKGGKFQIDRLESLIQESTKSTSDFLDQAKDEDSASIPNRILSFLLSDQGDYVRDMLLEELVKGLDALSRSTAENILSNIRLDNSQLFDAEDEQNLNTSRRIIALLTLSDTSSKVLEDESTRVIGGTTDISSFFGESNSTKWLSVILKLPFPLQQKLLALPMDVAGRLISRTVARTIRRLF